MLCSSDLNILLDLSRNEVGISFQILAPSLENALSWICNLDGFIQKLCEAEERVL